MSLPPIPSKISRKSFEKILKRPGESYVRRSVKNFLRKSKDPYIKKLPYASEARKAVILRATKMLKAEGLIRTSKTPTQLYNKAGRLYQQEQAAEDSSLNPHVQAALREDLTREIMDQEKGKDTMQYDPRGVLGKALIDDIDAEKADRDQKVASEKAKHDQLSAKKNVKPQKPILVDESKLPNIDIG